MNAERFQQLIDAYGARPERWPQAERAAAAQWLASTPEARALSESALTLDAALDAWTAPPPSAALRERILATAPRPRRRPAPARVWWAGLGLAAACAMGMVVGANLADVGLSPAASTAAATGAMTAPGDSLTVFGSTLDLGRSS